MGRTVRKAYAEQRRPTMLILFRCGDGVFAILHASGPGVAAREVAR